MCRCAYCTCTVQVNALADLSFLTDGCQLLTSSGAVMRAAVPGALLMVNVMADIPFWGDWVTQWATCAGKYIDVLGVDHYPGACCVGAHNSRLFAAAREQTSPNESLDVTAA